jgi:hypothetical protein
MKRKKRNSEWVRKKSGEEGGKEASKKRRE